MSRPPAAAKLTVVIRATAQPLELTISFNPEMDPPAGTVRACSGPEHRFSGWLGLLHLLETHCQYHGAETRAGETTEDA